MEEMRAFFAARVAGYDTHMLENIERIEEAYARVAALLPAGMAALLDLGCGTGLELSPVFARFPDAHVTGIDLTPEMLDALSAKFTGRDLTLLCGSYFDIDFGEARFDAALSFQTLHHFTHNEKRGLYRRVLRALRPGGVYIEADYTVPTQAEEDAFFAERARLVAAQGASEGFWHFDVPCTVANQLRLLREAGFESALLDGQFGNTAVMIAAKERKNTP